VEFVWVELSVFGDDAFTEEGKNDVVDFRKESCLGCHGAQTGEYARRGRAAC